MLPDFAVFRLRLSAMILCVPLVMVAQATSGQDSIDGSVDADVAEGESPAPVVSDTPLVNQTLDLAKRKPETLPRAIQSMTRIKEWAAVDQLLRQAGEANLDAEALADLSRRLGGSLYLRLSTRSELSAEAAEVLEQAVAADRAARESPERLAQAIKQLGGDVDARLEASRVLLAGGNASVVQIVSAIVGGHDDSPMGPLVELLQRLGTGGGDLLLQYAVYGQPDERPRAIRALYRLRHPLAIASALSSLHAADATESERTVAANLFLRAGATLPSRDTAIATITALIERQREIADRVPDAEVVATAWVLDPADEAAQPVVTDARSRQLRTVVDLGAMLRRLEELDADTLTEVAIDDLAYRVVVDPDWGDREQFDAALAAYPSLGTADGMLSFLQTARSTDRPPALVAGLRIISGTDTFVGSDPRLLTRDQPSKTVLVDLVSSSIPRLRYEAAVAIQGIGYEFPYAGKSAVKRTLAEMARLSDRPVAILLETRPLVRGDLSALLSDVGYDVVQVGSSDGALRALASGGDVRFVFAKTLLWDSTPVEFVDRVRRTTLGRRLPIVFYTDATSTPIDLDQLLSPRWPVDSRLVDRKPPITMVIDRPYTSDGLEPVLRAIETDTEAMPLSPGERALFRRSALGESN